MNEESILRILSEWDDAFTVQSFFLDALRYIGWSLVSMMSFICDGCYDTIRQIYSLYGFGSSEAMMNYADSLHPIVMAVLSIGLFGFGFYMLTRKSGSTINIAQSVIAIILILTILPAATLKAGKLVSYSSDYARSQYAEDASPSLALADAALIDLLKVDSLTESGEFSSYDNTVKSSSRKNSLTRKAQIREIEINEYMDYNGDVNKPVHDELFKYRITTDADGRKQITSLDTSIIKNLDTYYYRYHVDWGMLLFSMLAMSLAMLLSALKSARIIWEIGFHQIIGPFIAVTDMASGQRIKEFVRSLISLFAALFMISAVLGIYFVGIEYLGTKNISDFTFIICQLALAWLVIDGPNVVQRIIGVDVGLKDAKGVMMGAYFSGRAAGETGKAIAGTATAAGSMVSHVGKSIGKTAFGSKGMAAASEAMKTAKSKGSSAIGNITNGAGIYGAAKTMVSDIKDVSEAKAGEKMGPHNHGGPALHKDSPIGRKKKGESIADKARSIGSTATADRTPSFVPDAGKSSQTESSIQYNARKKAQPNPISVRKGNLHKTSISKRR